MKIQTFYNIEIEHGNTKTRKKCLYYRNTEFYNVEADFDFAMLRLGTQQHPLWFELLMFRSNFNNLHQIVE